MCNAAASFPHFVGDGGDVVMEELRKWLLAIIAAALVWAILETIVPKNAAGAAVRTGGGLMLLLVVVQPILALLPRQTEWKYEDYHQEIDQQIEEYRRENQLQMEDIIQKETGAYISAKAKELGLECRVQVDTVVRDGIPYPHSVKLTSARNEELSTWLDSELDIAPERQTWGWDE